MITGFNTDVRHEGHVYHVQTEDRGKDNPILESLVYVGGTIVAKKLTPYPAPLSKDAGPDAVASMLKRQHQVIIAAIKAGRIDDLIRHSVRQQTGEEPQDNIDKETKKGQTNEVANSNVRLDLTGLEIPEVDEQIASGSSSRPDAFPRSIINSSPEEIMPAESDSQSDPMSRPRVDFWPEEPRAFESAAEPESMPPPNIRYGSEVPKQPVSSPERVSTPIIPPEAARTLSRGADSLKQTARPAIPRVDSPGVNLDQVLEDYKKRESGQAKLDVKVITPEVFVAGRGIGLRIQVTNDSKPDLDATVTVKIIGTAFKPQVFIGRVGRDGVANFSITLPSFNTGTAAIVIEAQSGKGRGEQKNLIRRT